MTEFLEIGNNDGGVNPGYIRELYLVRKSDIITIENPIFSANNSSYVFTPEMLTRKDDAVIYKMNFVWRSCEWTESFNLKMPNFYSNTISFELSGTDVDARNFVFDNMNHEFIVFFGNRANQTFIVGNLDVGLELMFHNKSTPKNMMLVALSGEMTVPSFFTTEGDLDSFFNNFQFSEEFNIGEEFS